MSVPRTILVGLAVLVLAAVCAPGVAAPPAETEQIVKIRLHPMPETRPALKYQLLPPFLERRPGNAAVWWNRIPADQARFFTDLDKKGRLGEKIEKWMEIPLGDPREKQFRDQEPEIAGLGRNVLFSDMDYAARFESCDWQLAIREGRFVEMRIPDVSQTRTFARLLAAKAHLEIAEGNYDQAVRTFQTGFALAVHVARGQTLIHGLVGTAVAALAANQVEQFIQQPGAPNLYWALAMLPRPLVDYRPGLEGEMNSFYLNFPELKDLDKKQLSAEGWRELMAKVVGLFWHVASDTPAKPASGMAVLLALQGYPGAKQYLIDHGRTAAEVEAMPVAQVVLLYEVQIYQELNDDVFKNLFLPYSEGQKGTAEVEAKLRQGISRRLEIFPIAALMLPAVAAAKSSETRGQWFLARLQILEALRIYAAAHDGRLPDRLSDIREVPIPTNPYNDKPFEYRRDGSRAILTSTPAGLPVRYEITMAAQGDKR